MELRQLKYFLNAAELLSFTEAAIRVNISQSTLSQQIKQLETELEVPLFNRIGRQITLTEAGKLFITFARQSVKKAEEGRLMIKDLKNLKNGSITVGVAFGLKDFFMKSLKSFLSDYPEVEVKIIYASSHILFDKLDHFEVDLLVAFHEDQMFSNFEYDYLFDSPMVLAASEKSILGTKKNISFEEICDLSLIIATEGFHKNHPVYKSFASRGLLPKISLEINDIGSTLELVRSGNWFTVLVQTSIQEGLRSISIIDNDLIRTAKIIYLREAYQTHAMMEMSRMLKSAAKDI